MMKNSHKKKFYSFRNHHSCNRTSIKNQSSINTLNKCFIQFHFAWSIIIFIWITFLQVNSSIYDSKKYQTRTGLFNFKHLTRMLVSAYHDYINDLNKIAFLQFVLLLFFSSLKSIVQQQTFYLLKWNSFQSFDAYLCWMTCFKRNRCYMATEDIYL